MPINSTKGAASSQGFGLFILTSKPYWAIDYYDSNFSANLSNTGSYIDNSGNIYLLGYDGERYNNQQIMYWFTKVSSQGVLLSQKRFYGGSNGSVPKQKNFYDKTNNFIYVLADNGQLAVTKIDAVNATISWNVYQNSSNDTNGALSQAVAVDSSQNVYVCGYIRYEENCSINIYASLIKLNSSGTRQWYKMYRLGTSWYQNSFYYSLSIDSSSNIICVGSYSYSSSGVYKCLIQKFNSAGTLSWTRYLVMPTTSQFCELFCLSIDSSSNIYVGGYASNSNGFVAKYNSSGTLQWQNYISGGSVVVSSCVDSSDNVYFYDQSNTIYKFDSSGVLQWQRIFTGNNGNVSSYASLQYDSISNSLIIGTSFTPTGAYADAFTIKYPVDGSSLGSYTVGNISFTISTNSKTISTASLTSGSETLTNYSKAAVLGNGSSSTSIDNVNTLVKVAI